MEWVPVAGLLGGAVGVGSTAVTMGLLLAAVLALGALILTVGARRVA